MRIILLCCILILSWASFTHAQSDDVKNKLVEQMIKDGDVSRGCVQEEGGALKFLNVTLLYLNTDKQPEFLVTGTGCGCVGSVRCASSIYQKSTTGYRKIYRSESNEDVEVLKSKTKGYRNLRVTLISGSQTYSALVKFNGTHYR